MLIVPGDKCAGAGAGADKRAGSPLPPLNVLRTPSEVVSATELLNINQLLQGPLKGVLAEKAAAAVLETRYEQS
jgi:hypothetical protein